MTPCPFPSIHGSLLPCEWECVEQEEAASRPQPLAGLHVHRKTLAIIGILHCPAATEFKRAYVRFEQVCR